MKSIQKFLIAKIFVSILSFVPSIYASDPAPEAKPNMQNEGGPPRENRERRHNEVAEQKGDAPGHLNCGVCKEDYNEDTRHPQVLRCGHTYCASCVGQLRKHASGEKMCPNCRTPFFGPVPKNFSLIEAMFDKNVGNFKRSSLPKGARRSADDLGSDYDKPTRLVCELYNKQAQKSRCWGRCVETWIDFSRGISEAIILDPENSCNLKAVGWTFSQSGFFHSDLEQHEAAAKYLGEALEKFEALIRVEAAMKEPDEELLSLIRLDRNITWIHLQHQLLRLKRIDPLDRALMAELEMIKSSFVDSPRRLAQFYHIEAIRFHEAGDLLNAADRASKAGKAIAAEAGAEITTWTMIRIVADIAEQVKRDGNVPDFALLEPYMPHEWKKAPAWVKARHKASDDPALRFTAIDPPEMARALFDFGRLAGSFGLVRHEYELLTRAVDAITQVKTLFETNKRKFRCLPEQYQFDFVLPEWVEVANRRIASLKQELEADPAKGLSIRPEIEEIFQGF